MDGLHFNCFYCGARESTLCNVVLLLRSMHPKQFGSEWPWGTLRGVFIGNHSNPNNFCPDTSPVPWILSNTPSNKLGSVPCLFRNQGRHQNTQHFLGSLAIRVKPLKGQIHAKHNNTQPLGRHEENQSNPTRKDTYTMKDSKAVLFKVERNTLNSPFK